MKDTLLPGLEKTMQVVVDEPRTIAFLGDDSKVYATPYMLYDVEVACQTLIKEHLDDHEDSVGTWIDLTHMAATPMGLEVEITVRIIDVEDCKVTVEFDCSDSMDAVGKGRHSRYIVDKYKIVDQIRAKKVKCKT